MGGHSQPLLEGHIRNLISGPAAQPSPYTVKHRNPTTSRRRLAHGLNRHHHHPRRQSQPSPGNVQILYRGIRPQADDCAGIFAEHDFFLYNFTDKISTPPTSSGGIYSFNDPLLL